MLDIKFPKIGRRGNAKSLKLPHKIPAVYHNMRESTSTLATPPRNIFPEARISILYARVDVSVNDLAWSLVRLHCCK